MSQTERSLREALRRMAEEVGPQQELPLPILRRTRRRQTFVALATMLIVVSAGVAGFIGVEALRSTGPTVPANPTPNRPAPNGVPECAPGWTIAPQPDPPYVDQLRAISGTAWNDLWAVGTRFPEEDGDGTPLIEHWDGRSWSVIPGADEPEEHEARLNAVAAISRDDVWAAGEQGILEHWDGRRWSAVAFPSPPSMRGLDRIVAVSSDDVWILGHTGPVVGGGSISEDFFLHWDGRSWSLVEAPPPVDPRWGTSAIQAISASGPNDVWGVGGTVQGFGKAGQPTGALVERWDGRRWMIADAPGGDVTLGIVAATSDGHVWAARGGDIETAGTYGFGPPDLIYRWDGKAWSLAHRIRGGTVTGLVARSSDEVWAVGATSDGRVFIEHWDGTEWSSVASAAAPPSVSGLLPAATLTVDGTVVVFTTDYPYGLGGGDQNPNDQPNNYVWAACS
jgi:hypothetical protein